MSAMISGFRLSYQQRHLWPLQSANPSLNAWVAIMFAGPVDTSCLQAALNNVFERHEILRTTYRNVSGMKVPVQVIVDLAQLELRTIDVSKEVNVDQFIAEEVAESFDLQRGPLARTALAVLPSDRHLLVVTVSAMCADSRTLKNLFQDIWRSYADAAAEKSSEPVQYVQFSEWQHELLEDSDAEEGRDYWSKRNFSHLLDAPLQFEEDSAARFEPAFYGFEINPELTTALASLSSRFHVRRADLLMVCWQALQWRLNDGEEIVIGRCFDGRRYEELENSFGIFSKTLPLRVNFSEKRFSEVIRTATDQSRTAEQWQDYFESQASTKLAFEYFEAPAEECAGATRCHLYRFFACPDQYLLKSVCIHDEKGLRLELHYNQACIKHSTIKRIASHFDTLLKSIVKDPFEKIGSLEILNQDQIEAIFKTLSGRVEPVPRACIHELFEQQAQHWPERLALAFTDESITYKELDEKSNQLANHLWRLGAGPERAVGICLEPSIDMLVAILGVLKSGGFYVPLDPAYPHDRLSFMLDDTCAAVLISQRSIADQISNGRVTTVLMDEERSSLAGESVIKPDSGVGPENIAYVIYTSGSTGRPKGVLVSHENLAHSTLARTVYYQEFVTVYLLLSSFSFDSSVAGLFWTLCSGATLLLPAEEARRNMPELIDLVNRHRVSHLLCLPSLYSLLLDRAEAGDLASLRCVIVAGEACPLDLPEKHTRASEASFYNEYGPTEGTVWATVCKIENRATIQIPIGGPIANTQIYILDKHLRPVPFGVSGEIFIGGRGITRGYLNLPALSAEKFVPDSFGNVAGARLYRTGDRARSRPDGQIDFLGRFDQQVKLRGYRIELGEIESLLNKHPHVQESVCLVHQVEQGDERLLAFVVPGAKHSAAIGGRRRYQLPNNAAIVEHGRNEADFLYQELFEEQIYFKHGISLKNGDCVFDVGAHIGLFTMLVNRMRNDLRVYAFEPAPPLFELLQINSEVYCNGTKLFMCGLSNRIGAATLTFYPNFSMLSGYYADAQAEARIMKSFMQIQTAVSAELDAEAQYDELLSARFESEVYGSELRTLHSIIKQENIEQIDLLKIDVEKSEMDVLTGMDEDDWSRIKQLVAHVHDIDSRLTAVVSLLERFGFQVVTDEDQSVKKQGLYYVYARRGPAEDALPIRLAPFADTILGKADLASYVRQRMPDFMVPSNFLLVDSLPLLPNGKLNHRALLESVDGPEDQERVFVAPETPMEELLARIWSDVLKTDRIGIHDNFFDLGGHSFLAIKAHSRLSKALGRDVPLLKLFEYPTLQSLAGFLEQTTETSVPFFQTEDWAEKRRQSIAERQPWGTDNG